MLFEFKVSNFRSIKSEQILSFEPSSDNDLINHFSYEIKPGVKILKLALLYGSNASGKTNIIHSLYFVRELLIKSREKGQKTGFIPFLFDKHTINECGNFELTFFSDKNIKYNYILKMNNEIIFEERLYYYPKGQPAEVFTRIYDKTINNFNFKIGSTIKITSRERDVLVNNTLNNMTIVSAFSKTNINFIELEGVYKWATEFFMHPVFSKTELVDYTHSRMEQNTYCKNVLIDMLVNADFNIKDISVLEEEITEEILSELKKRGILNKIFNITDTAKKPKLKRIEFSHEVNGGVFNLPESLESEGTLRFYSLGGPLSVLIEKGGILLIDELESSLHFDLINYFMNLFLVNTKRAQLVFSTHNLNLISDSTEIRKDVVWFTEKKEDGSTELYSLDDFDTSKIRKGGNYLKAYNSGKFGAKPNIGSIYLEKCINGQKK